MSTPLAHFNSQHKLLRKALADPGHPQTAIDLFLSQHAFVHSCAVSNSTVPTLADTALEGLSDAALRAIPAGCEHSVAWILWHIARIEDVTMNMLLADSEQVFTKGKWQAKLRIQVTDTGNLMALDSVARLGEEIDIAALKEYRDTVGKRTREAVQALDPQAWMRPVDPVRIARLVPEGAVAAHATGVLEYWGGLTYAGLLLMPPTRHNLIHLNEIMKMKKKLVRGVE